MEFFSTGIDAVDKLGHLSIVGDVKPRIWQRTIVNENGKPQRLAMDMLAEIVYWYKPVEVRDERTGEVLGWKKKFAGEMLQKDYNYFVENYYESEKTISRALAFLENLGVIKRHRKSIRLKSGTIAHNVLFIELIYDKLYELTYPEEVMVKNNKKTGVSDEEYEIVDDSENADKMGVSTERSNLSKQLDKNVQAERQNCSSGKTEMTVPHTDLSKKVDRNDPTNTYNTIENNTEITTKNTTKNTTVISSVNKFISNPISSIQESSGHESGQMDEIDECQSYMQLIKINIGYDELMNYFDPEKRQRFEEMYQLICDVVCVQRKTVRVNGEDYPYQLVKAQFLKLNKEHIEYVSSCMDSNLKNVGNIRAYLITALYNAPNTYCNHVAQDYRADFQTRYVSDYDSKSKRQIELMKNLRTTDPAAYQDLVRRIRENRMNGGNGIVIDDS